MQRPAPGSLVSADPEANTPVLAAGELPPTLDAQTAAWDLLLVHDEGVFRLEDPAAGYVFGWFCG